jgi:PAS domain S-box-containing protein
MKNQPALKGGYENQLSVIYKAYQNGKPLPEMRDPVFQTDLDLNLLNWNTTAELLYGKDDAVGKSIFSLIDLQFQDSSQEKIRESLQQSGVWSGEVMYKRIDGNSYYFKVTATYLFTDNKQPQSVLMVCHNITDAKRKEEQLLSAEAKYQTLLNTLPEGVIMMEADGRVSACNKQGAMILGLSQEEILGKIVATDSWNAVKTDLSVFPLTEFPAVVSLQTGFPQRNVVMGIMHPTNGRIWVSVNSEALIRPGEFSPYAVVVSFKDITDARKTGE